MFCLLYVNHIFKNWARNALDYALLEQPNIVQQSKCTLKVLVALFLIPQTYNGNYQVVYIIPLDCIVTINNGGGHLFEIQRAHA